MSTMTDSMYDLEMRRRAGERLSEDEQSRLTDWLADAERLRVENEQYNGWANRETWAFNLHWQNDQGLYNETLTYARDFIDGCMQDDPEREVSDRELGEYVVSYWRGLLDEDEVHWLDPTAVRMWDREVGSWWRIDYAEVGAAVRESLDAESD